MSVRAILGQQVSVRAAGTLAARLVDGFGEITESPFEGLSFTFPRRTGFCALGGPIEDHWGRCLTGAKARAILALAKALTANDITPLLRGKPGG